MGELVGSAPVRWAIAIFEGRNREVSGVIGPFPSGAAANGYATDRNYADWRIVPAVWLAETDNAAGIEAGIEAL